MKKNLRLFFTTAVTRVEKHACGDNKNLELIRKEMQEKLNNKLKTDTYKQALKQQDENDKKNVEALEKVLKEAENTFKYSSVY